MLTSRCHHRFPVGLCLWLLTPIAAHAAGFWPGYDYDEWLKVTTWKQPDIRNDQVGSATLIPPLAVDGHPDQRIETVARWEKKRARIAGDIRKVLGEPTDLKPPPGSPAPVVELLGQETLDDHVRRHIRIRTEGDDWIPAYLLLPRNLPAGRRVAAMICLHQTVAQGKEEPCGIKGNPELDFALELVRRGYVCIAPDVIGFGERIPPGTLPYHDSMVFYRRHPGWSFMGKMIYDVGRVIDYLQSLEMVDPQRIGSIGHSHGAYGTLFATAFEPRIRAAVASCGFTTLRGDNHPARWSSRTALIPQIGTYLPDVSQIPFDWQDICALAAPRPLYVWYGTKDNIFENTDNLDALFKDVRGVYTLSDKTDALTWKWFDGAHSFPDAERERAYRWLEKQLPPVAAAMANAGPADARPTGRKQASVFYPPRLIEQARANGERYAWAAAIRDPIIRTAEPWRKMSDEQLWQLMFGNTIKRSWMVWSNGHCPACEKPVPMYNWRMNPLAEPWKVYCPHCAARFPTNDFAKFYRSGLDEHNVFQPGRADRALLFNVEHPDPSDPQHTYGVDDGEGYLDGDKRWRFIGAYLIYGQWKNAVVAGVDALADAYVITGDPVYAHKAGVLLDRVADLYPTFDFGKEGVMYEGPPARGYVSTWHDACVEARHLAMAYDQVFEGLRDDRALVAFLGEQARQYKLDNPKGSFADIQRNIEERILRDTIVNRRKIESNYPQTDMAVVMLMTVLGWPENRAEVLPLIDGIIRKATAVDGVSGEKGLDGYGLIAPHSVCELLGRYTRVEPGFLAEMFGRHEQLRQMYRFHIDTWCLSKFYPRIGDCGGFGSPSDYAGVRFAKNPRLDPSGYQFLWDLYELTGDPDYVRLLYRGNGETTDGLPYDLFAADPEGFQAQVRGIIEKVGIEVTLPSVNKQEWCLGLLRSGSKANERVLWLDYDSGGGHSHADAMNIGLFAFGMDLLPDFGYPPVNHGGWGAPRAAWYTTTAAHNTVVVDNRNTSPGQGRTTLWCDGDQFHAIRAAGPPFKDVTRYERTLAMVDVNMEDFYVLDVFRVAGGKEHCRMTHGPFSTLTLKGPGSLPTDEAPISGPAIQMRNFRHDPRPISNWYADFKVDDRLKLLPAETDLHLRWMDLTPGAETFTAESWVATGGYDSLEDTWIPSLCVRRKSAGEPLVSTFVGVIHPYVNEPAISQFRRLPLTNADGAACGDSDVAVEIFLVDGRRDVLMVSDAAEQPKQNIPRRAAEITFDGDVCLVRYGARGNVVRVARQGGTSLSCGKLTLSFKPDAGFVELTLDEGKATVVAGNAEALLR